MTEHLPVIIGTVAAAVGTGTLSCALMMHLLKSKLDTGRYEGEVKLCRDSMRDAMAADRQRSDENHKENKQLMVKNSEHIRVIRESLGYVIAKQAGKPTRAIKRMPEYKDMSETMVVEGLLDRLNGD